MQRQEISDFILSKKVGTYFLRKITVGHCLRESDSSFQNPRKPRDYPRSTFGIVQYKTSHGYYHSIGTLIGRNLLITVTPQFYEQFPHEEYQKQVLDFLKLKNNPRIKQNLNDNQDPSLDLNEFIQLDLNKFIKGPKKLSRYNIKNHELYLGMSNISKINERQRQFQQFYKSQQYNTIKQGSKGQYINYIQNFHPLKQRLENYLSSLPDDKISFITFDGNYIPIEKIMYSRISSSLPTGEYDKIQLISNQIMFAQLSQSLMDQYYGCLGLCFKEKEALSWEIQNIDHLLPQSRELEINNNTGSPLICSDRSKFYLVGLSINGKDLLFNNQEYNLMQKACLTLNYQASKNINQQYGKKIRDRTIFDDSIPDLTIISFKTSSSFPRPISLDSISNLYIWANIRQLIFDDNTVSHTFLKKLTRMHLLKLYYCSISSANFSNQHSIHLMKAYWPNLRHLCLKNNKLGKQGLQYLRKGYWPYFQTIKLNSNNIYPEKYASIYFMQRT